MAEQQAQQPSEAVIRMVVRRADGTVHDHGVVAAHYKNPIKQAWWHMVGHRLANRRIRKSNRAAEGG